jgi:predicted transposase YbfD/YdcC
MNSLIEELKKVKDFRRSQGKRYPLWLIFLIIILGTMQGYLGYRALGDFAKFNQGLIVKKFNIFSKKVPSYSTMRRVLMGVDWLQLQQLFNQWSANFYESDDFSDWVCLDGKSLKSTVQNYEKHCQNFVVMVSLYSQINGVVLGVKRFENKHSSEIQEAQELIRDCSLKNKVFTLDALHCQKPTLQSIVESGNHYIVPVKKNQKKLYQSLESVTKNQKPRSISLEQEQSHGRTLSRQV